MHQIRHESPQHLTVDVDGTLTREDYEAMVPALEKELARHGRLRVLIRLAGFSGWSPEDLLDELRFDLRRHEDFDRVAVLGERRLARLGVRIPAPFFDGEVRFYEDEDLATRWLHDQAPEDPDATTGLPPGW